MLNKSARLYRHRRFLKHRNRITPDLNETSLPRYAQHSLKAHRSSNKRTVMWLPFI